MIRALHVKHEFSDRFIAYMLVRNLRVEEDLIDQLFNSSEKRLARRDQVKDFADVRAEAS